MFLKCTWILYPKQASTWIFPKKSHDLTSIMGGKKAAVVVVIVVEGGM